MGRKNKASRWSNCHIDLMSRPSSPALRMDLMCRNKTAGAKQPNLTEIITWCNCHRCGPEGHILLWCVWERPWPWQAGTDRSLPLFTRLNHYLLRQEGHMQHSFICRSRSVSATHLWLWHTGFLFFPQGQVSKSGHKLKNPTLGGTGPTSETAASLSCLDAPTGALSSWKEMISFHPNANEQQIQLVKYDKHKCMNNLSKTIHYLKDFLEEYLKWL